MSKEYEEQEGKPFVTGTREEMLKIISLFSGKYEFALRQAAWEAIDNEQNTDILTMLTLFSALCKKGSSFWTWRKYIMETPEIWAEMLDEFLKNK